MKAYYYLADNEIVKIMSIKDAAYLTGFVKRQVYESPDAVPIPAGYKLDGMDVVPTAETLAEQARAEKLSRLDVIDRETIRALRAIAAGKAGADDTTKLAELEAEAEKLRKGL
jgi:hypothetical protein